MILTEYTLFGPEGPRLRTDSANVAQAWSNIGFRVTAETYERHV